MKEPTLPHSDISRHDLDQWKADILKRIEELMARQAEHSAAKDTEPKHKRLALDHLQNAVHDLQNFGHATSPDILNAMTHQMAIDHGMSAQQAVEDFRRVLSSRGMSSVQIRDLLLQRLSDVAAKYLHTPSHSAHAALKQLRDEVLRQLEEEKAALLHPTTLLKSGASAPADPEVAALQARLGNVLSRLHALDDLPAPQSPPPPSVPAGVTTIVRQDVLNKPVQSSANGSGGSTVLTPGDKSSTASLSS